MKYISENIIKRGWLVKVNRMKDSDFERCFFETVLEYGIKQYERQNKFAAAVYPEKTEDSANSTIIQTKFPNAKSGKPRIVNLRDAYRMAVALGQSVSSIVLEVETKLRLGWTENLGGSQLALVTTPKNEPKKNQPSISKDICITDSTNPESTNIEQPKYGQ